MATIRPLPSDSSSIDTIRASLLSLPVELVLKVLELLDGDIVAILASSSQALHTIIEDNILWKRICQNQGVEIFIPERPIISVFGDMSFSLAEEDVISPDYKIDYKQCYINDYLRKKKLLRESTRSFLDYPSLNVATASVPIQIPPRTECHSCSGMSKSFSPIQVLYLHT